MKICIIDNLTTTLLPGRESAAGLERVAKNDALFLAQEGHDVTFFYSGEEASPELLASFPFKAYRVNALTHEDVRRGAGIHINTWNKQVSAELIKWINNEAPDVFVYHGYTLSWAKAVLKATQIPLLYTVHGYVSDNFMYHSNRIKDYLEVVKLGGYIVTNTDTTKTRIEMQSKRLFDRNVVGKGLEVDYPWMVEFNTGKVDIFGDFYRNFMFVEDEYVVKPTSGHVIAASRAYEPKAVHKFHDIEVPTKIFWKEHVDTDQSWIDKQVGRFNANPNIEFFWNHPYDKIMDHFREAKVCLVTWPDETFGLTAFEAAQFGVPSIIFNKDEPHASHEFLARIYDAPVISYKDPDFKGKVREAIETVDTSMEHREHLARQLRLVYNRELFISEREELMKKAITRQESRKYQSLFDF